MSASKPHNVPSPDGTAAKTAASAGGVGAGPGPGPGPGIVSHGWLAANSEFSHADERKMGRAFSTSVGVHFLAVVVIALMMAWAPAQVFEYVPPENYDLVFVQVEGPGGGGGGGGNSSPEPPAKIEMEAVLPEAPVIEPVKQAPPPPALVAPVRMAAMIETPGTFTGLAAAPSAGLGTGGGGGTGEGTGTGPGTGSGIGPGTGGGFGDGVMRPGSGVENPTILRQVDPKYTPDAMRAKIQGIVELEAVVGTNGVITEIRVIRSLDRAFGLDEEAMKIAKQWLFRPGTFQGKAVAVLVVIQMEFRLH